MDKSIEENIALAYQTGMFVKVTMADGSSVEGVIEGRTEDASHLVVRAMVACETEQIAKIEFFSPEDSSGWLKGTDE
jgi:hypothetical protein